MPIRRQAPRGPLLRSPCPKRANWIEKMGSQGFEKLRILVVDDEIGMRLAICRALEKFSVRLSEIDGEVRFEVGQAVSGEEALEKMKISFPDILLLDHKLPGISGLDVLQTLTSTEHDLLTIMITAYASL